MTVMNQCPVLMRLSGGGVTTLFVSTGKPRTTTPVVAPAAAGSTARSAKPFAQPITGERPPDRRTL